MGTLRWLQFGGCAIQHPVERLDAVDKTCFQRILSAQGPAFAIPIPHGGLGIIAPLSICADEPPIRFIDLRLAKGHPFGAERLPRSPFRLVLPRANGGDGHTFLLHVAAPVLMEHVDPD